MGLIRKIKNKNKTIEIPNETTIFSSVRFVTNEVLKYKNHVYHNISRKKKKVSYKPGSDFCNSLHNKIFFLYWPANRHRHQRSVFFSIIRSRSTATHFKHYPSKSTAPWLTIIQTEVDTHKKEELIHRVVCLNKYNVLFV